MYVPVNVRVSMCLCMCACACMEAVVMHGYHMAHCNFTVCRSEHCSMMIPFVVVHHTAFDL